MVRVVGRAVCEIKFTVALETVPVNAAGGVRVPVRSLVPLTAPAGRDFRPRADAGRDLRRDAVVAQDKAHIPQPTGLALHDEMPKRPARLRYQLGTGALVVGRRRVAARMLCVEFGKGCNRRLKCAPEPAQHRGLFLAEFVFEQGGG